MRQQQATACNFNITGDRLLLPNSKHLISDHTAATSSSFCLCGQPLVCMSKSEQVAMHGPCSVRALVPKNFSDKGAASRGQKQF